MPVVSESLPRPRETKENTDRMQACPSFERCAAPKCPLDELYDLRVKYPDDEKCVAERPTRLKLGADLPHKGLFPREWAGIIRFYSSWENYLLHRDDERPVPSALQNTEQ